MQAPESFSQLLSSLKPSLGALQLVLEQHGVQDLEALRVLAAFSETRRAVLLRVDMGLNTFQSHRISEALQALVRCISLLMVHH